MRTGTASSRLLLMIVLSLGLSFLTMPLLKAGLESLLPGPEWLQSLLRYEVGPSGDPTDYSYDLGRASRRYLLLVTLGVFIALGRWIPWNELGRRGFRIFPGWKRHLLFGIGMGFAMAAGYTAMLLASGWMFRSENDLLYLATRSLEFAAGAAFISVGEEWFFRGIMFRGMLRDWGVCAAFIVAGWVFAVLHCISGSYRVAAGWDPTISARLFGSYFVGPDGTLYGDLRLVIGLFLLSVLLCMLYLRSGSLWVPIGTHGGMVFLSKLLKKVWLREDGFPDWLYGDKVFLVSGVACWVLLVGGIVFFSRFGPTGPLYRRLTRKS
jgi:membrane protease YdiL (CAAX protease family)